MPKIIECSVIPDEQPFDAWYEALDRMPSYSFFQTPEWCAMLQNVLLHSTPMHRWFSFQDGSTFILPAFSQRRNMGLQKLESLPWGTYGCPVGKVQTPEALLHAMKTCLSITSPVMKVTFHPLDFINKAMQALPQKRLHLHRTHILELDRPFDELFATKFQARNRTVIRKAQRRGITVRWSNERDTVSHLKRLYEDSKKRWGESMTLPIPFFDSLIHQPGSQVRIWLAEFGGDVAAADVMLYGKGEVQYLTGARDDRFDKENAARYLMSEIIKDACQRGYDYFNFGASGGLEGVKRFKEIFGGIQTEYYSLQYSLPSMYTGRHLL